MARTMKSWEEMEEKFRKDRGLPNFGEAQGSAKEKRIGSFIGHLGVVATVIVVLILADAPTWFWLGIGMVVWLQMKTQDWIRASR